MCNKSCLALLLLGLMAPFAHAEKADSDKPIQISADRGCMLDQVKGYAECDGAVVMTQGTLTINADHTKVTRDAKGNQTMLATGKIVTFHQKMDDTPDQKNVWVDGQASRIDYDTSTHIVVLTTNARVKKGSDLVIGNVITYNTETQVYQSTGGGSNSANKGRVTAILQPQPKKTNASDSTGKKP